MLRVDRNGQTTSGKPPVSFHPNSQSRTQSQDTHSRTSKKRTDMQLASKYAHIVDSDSKSSQDKKQTADSPAQSNSFQSFLLSKHLAKPELPNNSNVYRAISNERKLWAQPSKVISSNTGPSQPTNVDQASLDAYRGSQKPIQHKPQKRKREVKGIPMGTRPVINYKNQTEIMQKIFGSDQTYQEYRNLAEIGQRNPQRPTVREEIFGADNKNLSFSSPFNGNRKLDQSTSHLPQTQLPTVTKNNLQSDGPKRGPVRVLPQELTDQANRKVQDEAEKAFLELQNAKSAFFFENNEFQQNQTKSQSNGFSTMKTTQSSLANNPIKDPSNIKTATNFFNAAAQEKLINEDSNINSDNLRERLFVAEKVMKSLFERNRQLEQSIEQPLQDRSNDKCTHCETLTKKLELANQEGVKDHKVTDQFQVEGLLEFKQLMQNALASAQQQAKLHLEQYIEVRNQLQDQLQATLPLQSDSHEKSKERTLFLLLKQAKITETTRDQHYEQKMAHLEQTIQIVREYLDNFCQAESMFKEHTKRINQKENIITGLKEEITRRKYVEAKVQSYVTTLIQQNSKLRETVEWVVGQSQISKFVKSKCEEALEEEDGQQSDNYDTNEQNVDQSATDL